MSRTRSDAGSQRERRQIESLDQRDRPAVRSAVAALLQGIIASDDNGQIYLRAQYELQLYAVNQPTMRAACARGKTNSRASQLVC